MIDSNFRSPYQRLVINPLLKRDLFRGISPLMITSVGALSGLCIPLFLFYRHSMLALLFLAISGFCDTLDGSLARHREETSSKGAVLDIISDRLVEFAILLGLFLYASDIRGLLTIFMLGAAFLCVTSFLVVAIFQENDSKKSFYYSPGIMERAEAFLFFALMIIFPSLFAPLALLFGGLTLLTAIIRIFQFINN